MNAGGTLAPGRSADNPTGITTGITTIFGDFTAQANVGAVLEIQIGGTGTGSQHDFVNISGTAQFFGGFLNLELIDGFLPDPDDEFIVLTANSLNGFFPNAGNGQRVDTLDGYGSFLVHYGPTSALNPNQIVLTDFEFDGIPGDYNDDGMVNAADYVVWRKHEGTAFDLPNRHPSLMFSFVGPADYDVWRAHFGETVSGSGALANISAPEPKSGALLLVALLVMFRCNRKGNPKRSRGPCPGADDRRQGWLWLLVDSVRRTSRCTS